MYFSRILLALLFYAFAQNVFADAAVGLILDLQGNGKVTEGSTQRKLQLLTYLNKGSQISLDEGAKVSLSLYASRSTYRLIGPAIIEVDADHVTVIKGSPAIVKSMTEKLVLAAASSNLLTGAIRMRTLPTQIIALAPENGALSLNQRPNFSWASIEAAQYDFKLEDAKENIIASAKVNEVSWVLPASVLLVPGNSYKWSVSYTSVKDGHLYVATSEFNVATKEQIETFAKLKPAQDAVIEEWILYAAMLQSNRIFHEAGIAWRMIAIRRPDLEKVKDFAR